jgi:hypothetical protein
MKIRIYQAAQQASVLSKSGPARKCGARAAVEGFRCRVNSNASQRLQARRNSQA